MGGKKKTKWRKLPLEEFTKEIAPKQEEQPPSDTCQTDVTREENDFIPVYNGPPEVIQNYVEPYEYIDGIWYPTSCVVYNPGLFSNYVMPADACYYYCTMPEAGQMQEYMPVPYQEYTPALPKDTVYLLLPTQSFRPTQPVQNVTPEWQTRRRRRRYEGYAEYAVIPEKTSSSKTEEKDLSRSHVNSRKKNTQFNNFRRMSSLSDTSSSDGPVLDQNQISRKSNELKKNPSNTENKNGPSNINKEMSSSVTENGHLSKKNPEICGVHSKKKATTNDHKAINTTKNNVSAHDSLHQGNLANIELRNCSPSDDPLVSRIALENIKKKDKQNELFTTMGDAIPVRNEVPEHVNNLNNSKEAKISAKTSSMKQKDDLIQEISLKNDSGIEKKESQNSLPDIVSSSNKTANEKLQDRDSSCESNLSDIVELDIKVSPKPKSSPFHTSNVHNLFNSEALHNEMEMELKQLQNLAASQTNQSIYKLAYDENVTDQSSNSRSPSPVLSPEDHIPRSFTQNEIIVHEADTDDDAGSEDVELIAHRYESESYLNQLQNKNLYVNKLSLAVELLRTQENLPYDGEFKRIVGENNIEPSVHSSGNVNLGFRNDSSSCSPDERSLAANINSCRNYNTTHQNGITSQREINPSPDHSSDSAIFSDTDFNNLERESSESAKEGDSQSNENQDNTDQAVRAGYRRFGIAQRRFTPLPLNPCFCCIIM